MKKYFWLGLGIMLITTNVFYIGVYTDWSDGESHLFIKHKPSIKIYFYSPKQFYRFNPKELSVNEQEEEMRYQEFCGQYAQKNDPNPLLTVLCIQIAITFLTMGIIQIKKYYRPSLWKLFFHLVLNFGFTLLTLIYILINQNIALSIVFIFMLLLIHYKSMLYLFSEKKHHLLSK